MESKNRKNQIVPAIVRTEKIDDASIWVVTIDNPPVNSLTLEISDLLYKAITDFNKEKKSKILILTASGDRFFIGGVDINEILKINSGVEGVELAKKGQDLCNLIESCEKPIIAAITGPTVGGGNEIAIACHLRIASEKAYFQQSEVNLGIIPAFGGTQRLVRIIGQNRARKMILACEKIDAERALSFGIIDEITPHADVINRAKIIASSLASKSQIAIRAAQKAIYEGGRASFEEGLKIEIECFKKVCEKSEMKEALAAFREHRKPVFRDE